METLTRTIFLPIILVMDAWIFQYLMSVYYGKRRDMRVCMLLFASFLVFAAQLYSHEDIEMLTSMNDISETCLQLTFVTQITIIGRAVSVKVKVRSIVYLTHVAEVFVFLNWLTVIACEVFVFLNWLTVIACVFDAAGIITGNGFQIFGNVLESVSLVFVLVFRFYYLSISIGFRALVAERKAEFLVYVLLVFHELPFAILESCTGISWEFVQAIANRVLMVACILLNVRIKTRGTRSSYTVKSAKESTPPLKPSHRVYLKTLVAKATSSREGPASPDIPKLRVISGRSSTVLVDTNSTM
ncbi:hypothetical protein PHMEG_00027178 [Phytophthora megakarya]|uniref:Transmembrane protein n=1 Tax=Phytophthora megakarya TaxID=4795 RepID=A0A225V7H3_9STRA|nr:hypothetical protein PHMEG_00027178 [Phytophthora megakarya]